MKMNMGKLTMTVAAIILCFTLATPAHALDTDATVYTGGSDERVIGMAMNVIDTESDVVVRVRNEAGVESETLVTALEFLSSSESWVYVGSGASYNWETGRPSMEFVYGAQSDEDDGVRVVLEGFVSLTPGADNDTDVGVRVGMRF